ncbi:transcriptional regulator, LacI family [Xylanimonas cellulosilytica DSM 15894]|uniref:Transcriptional regulator, LacI family n=1 Tax=Xylanimonas cellulosilytica (strain DSM 15894 / JCM 12276 / CECT 5975 / KCTC 9989 / LMG 20990 / NBRC 107835 / XIL07) TaxID=446471 RepID=D1BYE1_XYLCX|nr:LacI family DNA-binding transcriptional regulator [Xylanimonas cellulosilytica]ACZ31813.1 transcriptional regulator, LacI family [Xylanimonas cellulosilytica DSM 15894]
MAEPNVMNMADIARIAGVSMATASRALNDAPGVAPATRARVQQVADELHYVVSPEASSLSGGSKNRVGVVTDRLSRWFFGAALEGVESELRKAGLDLLLYRVGDASDRREFFRRLPARRKVDAVIVIGIPVSEDERQRLELVGVPIVVAGGRLEPYPYVAIDDVLAGSQAMGHLLYLGHRRIAMIDDLSPHEDPWPTVGRRGAYLAALESAGITPDPALLVPVPWGASGGAEAMERLLSLPEPPTAVLAHSDEIAFGALQTLRRAGVRVPADVSVIGVDDDPFAATVDLTTVHQDPWEVGRLAALKTIAILRGEEVERATVLPSRLVPRGSTGPPRPSPE